MAFLCWKRRPHKDYRNSRISCRRRQDIFLRRMIHIIGQDQANREHECRGRKQRSQQRTVKRHSQHRDCNHDATKQRHFNSIQQSFADSFLCILLNPTAVFTT